jgi:hypothetical protein
MIITIEYCQVPLIIWSLSRLKGISESLEGQLMRRAKIGEEDQRPLLIDEDTIMSKDSTDPFYTVKE